MGSAEAGEGLTAVYNFEHGINSASASQQSYDAITGALNSSAGRISSVGLSGGFGSVTLGHIWSASYNSVGAITDTSAYYGSSQTSGRHGSLVSYAFSNDMMALQLDAVYGQGANEDDPNSDLEQVDFGLSVNIADMGKIAFANVDNKYAMVPKNLMKSDTASTTAGNTIYDFHDDSTWGIKTNTVAAEISVGGLRVYVGTQTQKKTNTTTAVKPDAYDPTLVFDDASDVTNSLKPYYLGKQPVGYEAGNKIHGSEIPNSEQKTTFFGFGGNLGDTGISYLFQWRDVKDSHKPWMLRLAKSLGGGASIDMEHANNDGGATGIVANKTRVNLRVDF